MREHLANEDVLAGEHARLEEVEDLALVALHVAALAALAVVQYE